MVEMTGAFVYRNGPEWTELPEWTTGQKFLRYRVYGSYGIAVVNTKILSIRSWIKSRGTAAFTQAGICAPDATPGPPPYGVNFFGTQTLEQYK